MKTIGYVQGPSGELLPVWSDGRPACVPTVDQAPVPVAFAPEGEPHCESGFSGRPRKAGARPAYSKPGGSQSAKGHRYGMCQHPGCQCVAGNADHTCQKHHKRGTRTCLKCRKVFPAKDSERLCPHCWDESRKPTTATCLRCNRTFKPKGKWCKFCPPCHRHNARQGEAKRVAPGADNG